MCSVAVSTETGKQTPGEEKSEGVGGGGRASSCVVRCLSQGWFGGRKQEATQPE